MSEILTLHKTFMFEASHVLPKHPGKCSRLHGHSWKLTVGVTGPLNEETGFVVDYGVLSSLVKAHIVDMVDHQHLGQGSVFNPEHYVGMVGENYHTYLPPFGQGFYPSSEHLVVAFARILSPLVQELGESELSSEHRGVHQPPWVVEPSIQLTSVSLDETCTCQAEWRREYKR